MDTCPICGGMGYVTRNVPVDHPDFGKAFPCACQRDILAARRQVRLHNLGHLEAFTDQTFESFRTDLPGLSDEQLATLRTCYERAWSYAQHPSGWLLLSGTYGSGKTHLAAAIANHRLAQSDHVFFITVPDLLDHLRSTFAPNAEIEYDEMFEQVRNTPLLILDDLGAESSTAWAGEKLYQLFNARYQQRLPTVITTNHSVAELDPRIRSRLADWSLTQQLNMALPDFRRGGATETRGSLSNLGLYGDMVFETFDLRERVLPEKERRNLREAYEIALSYAQHPENWLIFMGEHGSGKTHLAAAIANYRQRMSEQVVLVTLPDLLDYLRAAFSPHSELPFDRRFDEVRTAALLVIDHLDTSSATPWAREKLRQIVEYRYLTRLPTVFTTVETLDQIDPVVRSRLLDRRRSLIFAILAPDYRGGEAPPRPPHGRR